jgi:hypothetical protein
MNRPRLNFLIDSVAFVAFVFLTTTGILTRYVLPPGSGRFVTLWGLDRHGWGDIHFWIALVLLGVLALHLVLHWRWVACMVRGQQSEASGTRVALGGVGLARLLALAATPLLAPLERTGEPRQLSRLSPSAIPVPQNPQPRETIEVLGNVELHATSEAARMMEVFLAPLMWSAPATSGQAIWTQRPGLTQPTSRTHGLGGVLAGVFMGCLLGRMLVSHC